MHENFKKKMVGGVLEKPLKENSRKFQQFQGKVVGGVPEKPLKESARKCQQG